MDAMRGVVVPAKTPPAIARTLHAEIVKALQTAEVRDLIAKLGASVQPERRIGTVDDTH
jgi:tripartite-type tricarboxylate transporter receptor subunit TctC